MRTRLVSRRDRDAVLEFLRRDRAGNLVLVDLVTQLGGTFSSFESPPQVLAAREGGEIVGVASLRPSVVFDSRIEPRVLEALLPFFDTVEAGLVKSGYDSVGIAWTRIRGRRQAVVDRAETAYRVRPSDLVAREAPEGARARPAEPDDFDELVVAARASLREEGRPDPFDGDPDGFRRWVRGRLHRAHVVEIDGRIGFVGYADVQRTDGWLIQGVYAWPELRRRGLAATGMTALVRQAERAGADHVQLAVIEGNEPAIALYESLGFVPFGRLRTILFS